MSDPNENWLVKLYYGNKFFFILLACGADNGLVIAFINGKNAELASGYSFNLLVMVSAVIIFTKQIINVG
jgi:hypothetical protein